MGTWILQANPEIYPLSTMMRIFNCDTWSAKTNIRNTNSGDIVYLWQSGYKAGIYGKGKVISDPAKKRDEDKYVILIRYEKLFQQPILKEKLIESSELKDLTIINVPMGTCLSTTENQANELETYTRDIPYSKPLYNDESLELWKKKYQGYRQNRSTIARIMLDEYLLKRQNELLNGNTLDVESFISNFWYNSGQGYIKNQSIKLFEEQLFENPSHDFDEQIFNAINGDEVEIKGSLIFETRTSNFATNSSKRTKKSIVDRILRILQDNHISYQNKIEQLETLEYVDSTLARELVFVQSMGSIPIVNSQVKLALDILELPCGTNESISAVLENLSDYFGSENFIELHRFLLDVSNGIIRVPKFYWHFCGHATQEEFDKSSIFAPISNYSYHTIISSINPGDILISYKNQSIIAISIVTKNYGEKTPDEAINLGLFPHSEYGNYLKVNYHFLNNPVKRLEINEKQRIYSPAFNKNGKGIQGFLYLLPTTFVRYLRNNFEEVDKLISPLLGELKSLDESLEEDHIREARYLTPLTKKKKEMKFDISDVEFDKIRTILLEKNQIIFTGPPGTGKTYLAQEFAKRFVHYNTNWELVQFHPSYGYEDFIEGISVSTNEDKKLDYSIQSKIFREICERAIQFNDENFLLIIDEINRGDLATIFGELIFGLEYRDKLFNTVYSEKKLKIPSNLFIIGTMNSSDHSIKLMDQALKRRFYFYPMDPSEKKLKRWLEANLNESVSADNIVGLFNDVNAIIMKIKKDRDMKIGHSYFMKSDKNKIVLSWQYAVYPLLESLFNYDTTQMKAFKDLYSKYI